MPLVGTVEEGAFEVWIDGLFSGGAETCFEILEQLDETADRRDFGFVLEVGCGIHAGSGLGAVLIAKGADVAVGFADLGELSFDDALGWPEFVAGQRILENHDGFVFAALTFL